MSDKFWQIDCVGGSYRVTFGRTGAAGQTQTKTFASEREAIAAAEKVTAEKLQKGYVDNATDSASPDAGYRRALVARAGEAVAADGSRQRPHNRTRSARRSPEMPSSTAG